MDVGASARPKDAAPAHPRRRRHLLVAAGTAIGLLVVAYLVVLVVAPRIDRLHMARGGWRLHRCARLGGSIPVELPGTVGLRRGVVHGSPTAVLDGDVAYVAMPVTTADGRTATAVWETAYRFGPVPPARAANDVAAQVSDDHGDPVESSSADLVAAATSCAERAP